jgi:hypothetical protein
VREAQTARAERVKRVDAQKVIAAEPLGVGLVLEGLEVADERQGRVRTAGRLPGSRLLHLVELAPRVSPAAGVDHPRLIVEEIKAGRLRAGVGRAIESCLR